jgi:hypothetical protein
MRLYLNAKDVLSHLMLADLRSRTTNRLDVWRASSDIYTICRLATTNGCNNAPFPVIESIGLFITRHQKWLSEMSQKRPHLALPVGGSGFLIIRSIWGRDPNGPETESVTIGITSPLCIAPSVDNLAYFSWRIRKDKTILESDKEISDLLRCFGFELLERGAVGICTYLNLLLEQGMHPQAKVHVVDTSEIGERPERVVLTIWEHFIASTLIYGKCSTASREWKEGFSELVWSFLVNGADYHLSLWVYTKSQPDASLDGVLGIGSRKVARYRSLEKTSPERQFIEQNGGKASFRELIKFWVFDNEQAILEIIDKDGTEQELVRSISAIDESSEGPLFLSGESKVENQLSSDVELKLSSEILAGGVDEVKVQTIYAKAKDRLGSVEWGYMITFSLGKYKFLCGDAIR